MKATSGFGPFHVVPGARQLLRNGRAVKVGDRAFDLLMALLKARGAVVAKDELVAEIWPCQVVDESNLRFQVAALRRSLGAERGMIRTVAGRGYMLVQARQRSSMTVATPAPSVRVDRPTVAQALRTLLGSAGLRIEIVAPSDALRLCDRARLLGLLVLEEG